MESSGNEIVFGEPSGFDSKNCIDIWIDGPGDTTVRPCPPELLPIVMAERDKIARWSKPLEQPKSQDKRDSENPKTSPGHPSTPP